jgi:hypothetical protein
MDDQQQHSPSTRLLSFDALTTLIDSEISCPMAAQAFIDVMAENESDTAEEDVLDTAEEEEEESDITVTPEDVAFYNWIKSQQRRTREDSILELYCHRLIENEQNQHNLATLARVMGATCTECDHP